MTDGMRMQRGRGRRLARGALALIAAGCSGNDAEVARRLAALPPTPAEYRAGEQLYDRNCARCHGARAAGAASGPPLAHRVYVPGHHSDQAFYLAARNGVAAHHWRFGNMPPQPQISAADMAAIVAYVRWVQRAAGVY
jgi:mono/diheme cytochrome c family protein